MTDPWNLRQLDLLAGLEMDEIEAVLRVVTAETFEPGAFIVGPGATGKRLYLLYHGRVKSFIYSDKGQEKVIHVFSPGDAFGNLLLDPSFGEMPLVQALDDVEVISMGEEAFKRLVQAFPQLALNLCRYMAVHHATDMRRLRSFIHTRASHRLVLTLLDLGDRLGQGEADLIRFNAYFTHADLANMIGVARSTVSELLGQLREAGVVSGRGRDVVVHRCAAERFLQDQDT
ncbi:MAG: Crp/Fnr family transcriptional regulator [Chloroflexota bacterium]|nr:Crp/Fnr family transcriptional regulator [Chloroflexota bacterium]